MGFICQEVLKNAVKATMDGHCGRVGSPPPVQVAIRPGKFDVEVKISDQGGGIKRRFLKRIWEFGYSVPAEQAPAGQQNAEMQLRMSGYGVGAPLSRLFARYYGGDLNISSVYGFGTDVSIRFNRLGDHAELGCSIYDNDEDRD